MITFNEIILFLKEYLPDIFLYIISYIEDNRLTLFWIGVDIYQFFFAFYFFDKKGLSKSALDCCNVCLGECGYDGRCPYQSYVRESACVGLQDRSRTTGYFLGSIIILSMMRGLIICLTFAFTYWWYLCCKTDDDDVSVCRITCLPCMVTTDQSSKQDSYFNTLNSFLRFLSWVAAAITLWMVYDLSSTDWKSCYIEAPLTYDCVPQQTCSYIVGESQSYCFDLNDFSILSLALLQTSALLDFIVFVFFKCYVLFCREDNSVETNANNSKQGLGLVQDAL
jgi:hypothetical protein